MRLRRETSVFRSDSGTRLCRGQKLYFRVSIREGKPDRLPALADELVRLKVDVLVMSSPEAARAAKNATRQSPSFFYL